MEYEKSGVGIIIGRFQVPEFHDGHKHLLDFVRKQHDRVIVLLGCAYGNPSIEDTLDFGIRQQMIFDMCPEGVTCIPIFDMADDDLWSREVDRLVGSLALANPVTLYGGRDSFISHYNGKYRTTEVPKIATVSGTEVRRAVGIINDPNFRRGIIWGIKNQFPRVNPTVDIALINGEEVLLAYKKGIKGLVFPGGYFDTTQDKSFEDAAVRELFEETSLTLADGVKSLKYLGSTIVDDWRDKGKRDKTLTVLFSAGYFSGFPKAKDDIDGVEYTTLAPQNVSLIAEWHKPLFVKLLNWWGTN